MVSSTLSPLFLIVSETWGFLWRKAMTVVMSITGDNEGHAAVLSASIDTQTGRELPAAGRRCPFMRLCPLISLSRDQNK